MRKKIAGWIELGCGSKELNDSPSETFHGVEVVISKNLRDFRVDVLETWGSNQGHIKEHGRNYIVAIKSGIESAVELASEHACTAGIRKNLMIQALSIAYAEAYDVLESEINWLIDRNLRA